MNKPKQSSGASDVKRDAALTVTQAVNLLHGCGQAHVMRFWDRLDGEARDALLRQVAALDVANLKEMQQTLATHLETGSAVTQESEIEPAPVMTFDAAMRATASVRGEEALHAGRVGAVLVAGGQGSRLGFDGPKGAYAIGPVSGAPLFYFHARKLLALTLRTGKPLPLYVMTSDVNDAATRQVFAAHDYFGLSPDDVFFFTQGMWPALDGEGKIILDAPGHLFMSPDGHGGTLSALEASGGLDDMTRRGLDTIFYFQVDNPLIEVADPAFIGLHLHEAADISLKVCAKRDAQEGMGVVVQRDGHYAMVEYTELTDEQKNRRTPTGDLLLKYGSVAIHIFSLAFLRQEAARSLPIHVAHKKIPFCDDDGVTIQPTANNGYKFEKFIFDVLPQARKAICLAFERRDEFSPVKNAEGADSPATCRRDLQAKWARWFAEAGLPLACDADGMPALPLEIDPAYATDAATLKKQGVLLKA